MTDADTLRLPLELLFHIAFDEGMAFFLPVVEVHNDNREIGEANILELLGCKRSPGAPLAHYVYLAIHIDLIGITQCAPNLVLKP